MGIPKSIPYLSERFLNLMEIAIEEAARNGMTVFLYDEGSYPSGSAHGMIVEGNPEYASRGLKVLEFEVDPERSLKSIRHEILCDSRNVKIISIQLVRMLSRHEIDLESLGEKEEYERVLWWVRVESAYG